MDTMTIPTQAPDYFVVPRERITAWAAGTLQCSGMSTARTTASNAAKGATGDRATGELAFEDPF